MVGIGEGFCWKRGVVRIRIRIHESYTPFEIGVGNQVIGIEKHEVFSLCMVESYVAACRGAFRFPVAADKADAAVGGSEGGNHFWRIVR